jgi:myo-inositol catabolism protein IolC
VNRGYDRPLYLLPCDHRQHWISGGASSEGPLPAPLRKQVRDGMQLVHEGYRQALAAGAPAAATGLLVDGDLGAEILRDARQRDDLTALAVELGGDGEADADLARRIETFDPLFAVACVGHNPQGDREQNQREALHLARLADHCRRSGRRLILELRVPPTAAQLAQVDGDTEAYELQTRPLLMQRAIRELQRAGVEPDVWAFEGLARRDDCERVVATVRHNGRGAVSCIALGGDAHEATVRRWLGTAARVEGYVGFAVGSATCADALTAWHAGTLSRAQAAARIAERLLGWIGIFESERLSRSAAPDGGIEAAT